MSATTGLNETAAASAIDQIISGGADVRLLGTDPDYDDGATELSTKEISGSGYTAQTVAEIDWTVTPDAIAGTSTLTNDNEIDFGQAGDNWGEIRAIVIDGGGGAFIRADEPTNPDVTTGAEVSVPPGGIEYTLGNN